MIQVKQVIRIMREITHWFYVATIANMTMYGIRKNSRYKPKNAEVSLIAIKTAIVVDYQFYTSITVEFKAAP